MAMLAFTRSRMIPRSSSIVMVFVFLMSMTLCYFVRLLYYSNHDIAVVNRACMLFIPTTHPIRSWRFLSPRSGLSFAKGRSVSK